MEQESTTVFADRHIQEINLVFEPQSGGSVPEKGAETTILRQLVSAVFQKLGVHNAINPVVQKKGIGGQLNLDSTLEALGLKSGDKVNLAWQVGGGR